jgi:predicted ATP-dependent protease
VAARCQQEKLLPFDRTAVARVVDFGARLAEHQNRLSTHFGDIADVIREASYWAQRAGRPLVTAVDVDKAIEQRAYRANRLEEEGQEMIAEGFQRIQVQGEALGQVNGLTVPPWAITALAGPHASRSRPTQARKASSPWTARPSLAGACTTKGCSL